jgi:hypothetical protein
VPTDSIEHVATDHSPDHLGYFTREEWWSPGLYLDEDSYYRFTGGEMDTETFDEAALDLGRNEGPALLFDLHCQRIIDVGEHPAVVASVWTTAEFPESKYDPRTIWVDLFGEAGYTHDGKRAPRPSEPVTVYRGCSHDRRFGMSWSTDVDRARWFADRDLGKGKGHVYVVTAPPESLLAFIHEFGRSEAEYVIDPQYLSDDNVKRLDE